jgi:predicted ArsR family transcriptional regulator
MKEAIMSTSRVEQRFFTTTRGRIIALLRRASRTVEELAQALSLTDNAVRVQLATLERDGIVEQRGTRRSARKPSAAYALTEEGERLFPKAYGPVLRRLLDVLAEELPPEELEALLRTVGRRLAAEQPVAAGDRAGRVAAAVGILNELGGLAELEEEADSYVICGYSCPLSTLALQRPEVCQMAEALLSELTGEPVQEQCERGAVLQCRFRLPRNGAHEAVST